jgi:hypothetical protein
MIALNTSRSPSAATSAGLTGFASVVIARKSVITTSAAILGWSGFAWSARTNSDVPCAIHTRAALSIPE